MSPSVLIPISRRYSLFRSPSMSIWMRLSWNTCAYLAAVVDGMPAATKNFTHVSIESKRGGQRVGLVRWLGWRSVVLAYLLMKTPLRGCDWKRVHSEGITCINSYIRLAFDLRECIYF